MQFSSNETKPGARWLSATRPHPLHTHLTDLLGYVLVLLFVGVGGPYAYAGDTPAKPDIDAIRNGDVEVQKSNGKLQIQASDGSIIDYSNFDIPQNYEVQFNQGSASARVLNRDQSGNRSIINGAINADGQVYIANPAGFAIGASASINVGRFVAAAGHISDESFLDGQDRFTNLDGTVINKGEITAGGVNLLGERVENYGRINAPHGTITMTAGETVYLGKATGHTFVEIQKTGDGSEDGAAVTNDGTISAKGGSAKLAAGDVYSTAVEQNGLMDVSGKEGGDIEIAGGTDVSITGDLLANGTGGSGGTIDVVGQQDTFVVDATISASGTAGGGTVRVGGPEAGEGELATAENLGVNSTAELTTNATENGDGGKVVAWSDGTTVFDGTASATGGSEGGDGGFVEISGSNLDASLSSADVSAPAGEHGTLLFDPDVIQIEGGTGSGNTSDPFQIGFGDDSNEPFIVTEGDLQGTSADIELQARDLIETTGSFEDGVIGLNADVDLTLETRNRGTEGNEDAPGGILLDNHDDGNPVGIQASGSGSVTMRAATGDNPLTADVTVGAISTEGEDITINTQNGDVSVQGQLDTTVGGNSGGAVNLTAGGGAGACFWRILEIARTR